jgi:hypothetical protein
MNENICKCCGKKFVPRYDTAVYCSDSCRATHLAQYKNFLGPDGRPYNFNKDKIRNCLICNKKLHHQTMTGYCRQHYKEHSNWRKNISTSLKGKTGGPRKGAGVGKSGWYKGYWCDSSWELAWVIFHIDKGIAFERNLSGFEYQYKGFTRKYYPDFKIDNHYIEIKGYKTKQFEEKLKAFPHEITVLYKKEMSQYINYVTQNYSKDYIDLYDARP